jgi:hypothetical protein
MVNVWLCPTYMCIRVQNYSCGTKFSKHDLVYMKLCDICANFVINVYSHFAKIICIFYILVDTKYIQINVMYVPIL